MKYLSGERAGRIVVRGRRLGSQIRIEIEDNGRGVAPSDQERIFDLFRRAGKQDRPGEGIGLAHVRALVRRLGGEIEIQSDGRTGSVFSITLPSDLSDAISKRRRQWLIATGAVTIVMIEDDEGHARLIEKNIRRAGVCNEIIGFDTRTAALEYSAGRLRRAASDDASPAVDLAGISIFRT